MTWKCPYLSRFTPLTPPLTPPQIEHLAPRRFKSDMPAYVTPRDRRSIKSLQANGYLDEREQITDKGLLILAQLDSQAPLNAIEYHWLRGVDKARSAIRQGNLKDKDGKWVAPFNWDAQGPQGHLWQSVQDHALAIAVLFESLNHRGIFYPESVYVMDSMKKEALELMNSSLEVKEVA